MGATWVDTPPEIDRCGNALAPDATPLIAVRPSRLRRLLSPTRIRFVGCQEGTPLLEVRLAWWHPIAWSEIARRAFLDTLSRELS